MHSLHGKMLGTKMGDRYAREKPKKSEEKKAKRAKRDEAQHSMKVCNQIFYLLYNKSLNFLFSHHFQQHLVLFL